MNPAAVMIFWLVVVLVCSFLSYRQGRHDEELEWRRVATKLQREINKERGLP